MAAAAASASVRASGGAATGSVRAPRETFVRHSPSAATRRAAPTTRPPATTTRRSQPSGGTSSCASAPCSRNQPRNAARSSAASRSSAVRQRTTSRPQLPKRGLRTSGSSGAGAGMPSAMSHVCGCGRPASRSARAVSSLSCAATSVLGRLSTSTPAAVRRSSSSEPLSTPSRPSRTSSRPSATSPGSRRRSASRGGSTAAGTPSASADAASASFVSLDRWATTTNRIARIVLPARPAVGFALVNAL